MELAGSMCKTFAKTMVLATLVGIALMVAPAIMYFAGSNQFAHTNIVYKYWSEPPQKFWKDVADANVGGYGWLITHYKYFDCLSIIGSLAIMFVPLLSMIAATFKADKRYLVLLLVAIAEFSASLAYIFMRGF